MPVRLAAIAAERAHFAGCLWRSLPWFRRLPVRSGYEFGQIDASGRVADRVTVTALGWRPGDRLILTVAAGVVLARRDPGGPVTMPTRPYVAIPAALRHRCGLEPGDRVLLAAFPGQDALAVYSFAVVGQALSAHVPFPRGDGGRS